MYQEISKCRICGNRELATLFDLGEQYLTGIFPKSKDAVVEKMPLELVKCVQPAEVGTFPAAGAASCKDPCGLVQLRHTGDLSQMYGMNYGYRSGLNASMVQHLNQKVKRILETVSLQSGDLVIDIGSNDSTTLQAYPRSAQLVGIDPTGVKFKSFYPEHIQLIPNFFDAQLVREKFGHQKAKVITSFSMFYDLEDPMLFMRQVHEVLDEQGIWVFEQSYMPTMLEMNSYDTICHEHLEYYGLHQIKYMTDRVGFRILDVELNSINGGSFSVMVAKKDSHFSANEAIIRKMLAHEQELGLHTLKPYEEFKVRVIQTRNDLLQFIDKAKREGKKVYGYGASTKGNVLLQYCQMTENELSFIAELNETKFGCFTPGSRIPIISEKQAKEMKPDYFVVLPWHFKENIISRETQFLKSGGKLLFPLPQIQVV